ncbi:MAG TPA: hypothetical protein VGJ07_27770 [Rugosimonospora sp.]
MRVFRAGIGLAIAGCTLLAMSACGLLSRSGDQPSSAGLHDAAPSPTTAAAHPAPTAPTAPTPTRPILTMAASMLADRVGGRDQIGNLYHTQWSCAGQQHLSDGQNGYHCAAAGDVYGSTGTFVLDVGANNADQITSVYIAALGKVPLGEDSAMNEDTYIQLVMEIVSDSDPAMDQQFSDEPLDTPSSPGQTLCTETDVKVQTVKMGPVLLQWGACSGDWAPWYTVRITAR